MMPHRGLRIGKKDVAGYKFAANNSENSQAGAIGALGLDRGVVARLL